MLLALQVALMICNVLVLLYFINHLAVENRLAYDGFVYIIHWYFEQILI